jgi:carbon monoxide dehydrogenase subunit G
MIETTQTVPVGAPIDAVWNYVREIGNWAELMPGLQGCDIIDEDNSRWVLKVGVGAMVRTVKVQVHVDEWDGPARARFSFKLQGDPVTGSGSYLAVPRGAGEIEMSLCLRVEGGGPMAPMWEAMGGPLLPKFALAFAEQLADGIEGAHSGVGEKGEAGARHASTKPFALLIWFWRALFGRSRRRT